MRRAHKILGLKRRKRNNKKNKRAKRKNAKVTVKVKGTPTQVKSAIANIASTGNSLIGGPPGQGYKGY
jgi:hypothetical protein